MKPCIECGKEAIFQGGITLCLQHIYRYDTPIISEMLQTDNPKLKELFFIESFKTVNPTFSLFPLLYQKFPQIQRGKYRSVQEGFEKSQKQYLNECFKEWLKMKLKED